MTLAQYLDTLRKRWLTVVGLTLICLVVALGYAFTAPRTYAATSKIFVSVGGGQTASDLVQGTTYIKNIVDSYAALTTLPVVLDPVTAELGLDNAPPLATRVSADAPLNTSIIEITVRDTVPDRAALTSNAIADQLARTVADLAPSTSDRFVKVSVVARAGVPKTPVSPRVKLIGAVALGLGLFLGVALALIRQVLDTRVKSAEDLNPFDDTAAVVASVPVSSVQDGSLGVLDLPRSAFAEAYRRLQTNLAFIDVSSTARVLVVTSSIAGEGKTTVSINLAATLAESGHRVLLIDADLRRPRVHEALGLEGSKGLTTVLTGDVALVDVLQQYGARMDVLTSGEIPPNPHQLISAGAMREVLSQARDGYDMVVVDSPPLLPVSDATILARATDGALLVVGARSVRRQEVAQALEALSNAGAQCFGVVLNRVRPSGPRHEYYGVLHPARASRSARLRDRLSALRAR